MIATTDPRDPDYVKRMVTAYIECALWSTTSDDGQPLDENFGDDDVAPVTRTAATDVCAAFTESNADDLAGMSPEQAGHDLWLTRERHGAGFWDRGLGARGDRLTDSAHGYGGADWYAAADGLIYGSD